MIGKVDITLFRREVGKDFVIIEIYVDDIIFGSNNDSLFKDFYDMTKNGFEMIMIRELKFFSWL